LAFEPAPETFRMLKRNVERNDLKGVVLYNKALSDKEGELMFYGDLSEGSSLFREGKGAIVDVVRLSPFIKREIDLLKMDIEGAEEKVLNELAVSGKLSMIQKINVEYHHHLFREEKDELSGFVKILEDFGFGYQIFDVTGVPYRKGSRNIMKIFAYRK
jgi:FkbM family methyltransferase